MYVITGATGNIGRVLTNQLLDNGEKVRVISRDTARVNSFLDKGAEPFIGDQGDVDFLTKAFKGATAVFAMLPPNYAAENHLEYQKSMGATMVTAIKNSGVTHVVALSSIGAHLPENGGIVQGMYYYEQKLHELKDVQVAILLPSYFMENLYGNIGMIKGMNINGSPLKRNLKFPLVATKDIAQMAFEKLTDSNLSGISTHYVLGPHDVSSEELTQVLSQAIDKDIPYVEFSYEEAEQAMKQFLSPDSAKAMVKFYRSMNEGLIIEPGIRNASNSTQTTLEEFAKSFAYAYNQN